MVCCLSGLGVGGGRGYVVLGVGELFEGWRLRSGCVGLGERINPYG